MGSAHKYGRGFRAKWRDAAGKQQTKAGFAAYSQAKAYADEMEVKAKAGIAPLNVKMTWGEYAERWWSVRATEKTTASSDKSRLKKWLRPKWQDKPLAAITQHDIRVWVKELRDAEVSPASIQKIYFLFSSSIASAVEEGILPATPCVGIKLPPTNTAIGQAWTLEEMERVIENLMHPYNWAVEFMTLTGMRINEMAGLHWEHVVEDQGWFTVANTWTAVGGMKAYPKGRKYRVVPLPDRLLEKLERPDDWDQPCGIKHPPGSKCRSQLVIVGPRGGPLAERNIRDRHWLPALKAAKLAHGRMHDLRHTYVSWLIDQGMDAEKIGPIVGHTSAEVTRIYTHLLRDNVALVRQAMNAAAPGRAAAAFTKAASSLPEAFSTSETPAGTTAGTNPGTTRRLKIVSEGL